MKDKMLIYNLKLNQEYFLITYGDEWKLQRNKMFIYDIMTSKDNTEEELKQFVKEHTIYNLSMAYNITNIICSLLALILSIINLKYNLVEIRFFIWGMLFVIFAENIPSFTVKNHNDKIQKKILDEDKKFIDDRKKEIEDELSKELKNEPR